MQGGAASAAATATGGAGEALYPDCGNQLETAERQNATATSTAMQGGAADATATATGGAGGSINGAASGGDGGAATALADATGGAISASAYATGGQGAGTGLGGTALATAEGSGTSGSLTSQATTSEASAQLITNLSAIGSAPVNGSSESKIERPIYRRRSDVPHRPAIDLANPRRPERFGRQRGS